MQNNILKARKDKGLSQADLAKRIGVTRQSISLYENNSREPKIDTWQKLSNVLGVSIPYLQGISSDPIAIDETIAHTMTNRELKKIIDDFEHGNKTPEDAEKILSAIKKSMSTTESVNQMRLRAMNQLVNSIDNLDLEKMDTFEMLTINDAIQLCTAFYNGFHSDRGLSASFGALLSGLRSIVKNDGQVDYVKSEFMSSFEQLLDAVTAKHA
ncbi:helix-turn-helix domain-containing protein [Lacticaseibacillus paracasei subsp. paracasei]|uniref:helix-turn-helix domain-containing protein n=1 Tax=Lacticaseibacillus paracasei TaxID=1597 RepID=UPI0005EACAC0|nr:helix-turn-helix domain-containing protein [Lacticaseibacillus paracasei]MCD0432324.1 helix-turn-helix domain-containing protein [Lacticaseibacillus paracasei subsp. paracasei]